MWETINRYWIRRLAFQKLRRSCFGPKNVGGGPKCDVKILCSCQSGVLFICLRSLEEQYSKVVCRKS
jgi:hypothetical protein